MSAAPAWKVTDLNSDLHRLSALINVICELQFELALGETDPRVDDLLWIAREIADGLVANDDATPPKRMTGGERNG